MAGAAVIGGIPSPVLTESERGSLCRAVGFPAKQGIYREIAEWTGGRVSLRILSNLADRRLARTHAVWPLDQIGGADVRDGVISACHFAAADPYRAATHNKGIMNGVSAVVLATGNDTRAVEAGAHAYAARQRPILGLNELRNS